MTRAKQPSSAAKQSSAKQPKAKPPAAKPPKAPSSATLTHVDDRGAARMVEVGAKPETAREAIASGEIRMAVSTADKLREGALGKGDALAVARIAAISATKQAHLLIPLCHPVRVTGVDVELDVLDDRVVITVAVRAFDRTGIEMEALTAVAAAALTIYDMGKAIDRGMVIGPIQLEAKRGGRSGLWTR